MNFQDLNKQEEISQLRRKVAQTYLIFSSTDKATDGSPPCSTSILATAGTVDKETLKI